MDTPTNNAKSTLASGITSGATSLTVATGDGAKFKFPANAWLWNVSDYGDPSDDPNHEIVRITNVAGDVLTITRGQEGTTGVAHNTGGKTYAIVSGVTAKTLTEIHNAHVSGAPLWNAKWVNAFLANAASGENDLYTVPAGRAAILISGTFVQSTGSAINAILKLKSSGTYYRGSATTASNTGVATLVRGNIIPAIAGESFSANLAAVGVNVWLKILEFDAASPVAFARLFSFASGDNTFYTCPVGFSATPLSALDISSGTGTGVSTILFGNDSGGSRALKLNLVLSGGSIATTNQLIPSQTAGSAAITGMQATFAMNAGDFLNINTDAATATQWAFAIFQLSPG